MKPTRGNRHASAVATAVEANLEQALRTIAGAAPSSMTSEGLAFHGITGVAARFGAQAGLNAELIAQASEASSAYVAQWMAWQHPWNQVLEALPDALVLKGAGLTRWLYREPGDRPVGDLDLLIPEGQRPAAVEVLGSLGFQSAPAVANSLSMCQQAYVRPGPVPCHVDLHWRSSNRPLLAQALPYRVLAAGAVVDGAARLLSPRAAFLHAAGHLLGHHGHDLRWKWLLDLHLLWLEWDGDEREALVQQALELELAPIVDATLALLSRRLATAHTERARATLLTGARQPSARLLRPGLTEWHDFRSLNRLTQRARYVTELLLPDRRYMRERGLGTSPLSYLKRAVGGLRRRQHRS